MCKKIIDAKEDSIHSEPAGTKEELIALLNKLMVVPQPTTSTRQ
jgi:hypothetical protein